MKQYTPEEALCKAAGYCTTCERCKSEVSTKLTAWGIAPDEQRKILTRLQAEGFIDEQRYCRAFVNDKLHFNRWGRIKIAAVLHEKKLPEEYITEAIEQIDEEEYTHILSELIAAKRKEYKGADDYPTRQKIMRFAASRGFESSKITAVVKCNYYEMD